jgi:hypothetical protein
MLILSLTSKKKNNNNASIFNTAHTIIFACTFFFYRASFFFAFNAFSSRSMHFFSLSLYFFRVHTYFPSRAKKSHSRLKDRSIPIISFIPYKTRPPRKMDVACIRNSIKVRLWKKALSKTLSSVKKPRRYFLNSFYLTLLHNIYLHRGTLDRVVFLIGC